MKNQLLILRRLQKVIKHINQNDSMVNNNYTEYGYRGGEEVKNLKLENSILKENIKDLQEQLQNAYKRTLGACFIHQKTLTPTIVSTIVITHVHQRAGYG